MPDSWTEALNSNSYQVDLQLYKRKNEFHGFFEREIIGDRNSTIEFENYYREKAPKNIEVYFEVIFWKLYSLKNQRQGTTIISISSNCFSPDIL